MLWHGMRPSFHRCPTMRSGSHIILSTFDSRLMLEGLLMFVVCYFWILIFGRDLFNLVCHTRNLEYPSHQPIVGEFVSSSIAKLRSKGREAPNSLKTTASQILRNLGTIQAMPSAYNSCYGHAASNELCFSSGVRCTAMIQQ